MTILEQVTLELHQVVATAGPAYRLAEEGTDSSGQRHTRLGCWCGLVVDGEGTLMLAALTHRIASSSGSRSTA